MISYLILFTGVGAAIARFVEDKKTAICLIIVIAAFWGVSQKLIWGLVTLGELFLGYGLIEAFFKKPEPNHDDSTQY